MLTRRTVFVLGAGANVPYGFSTGTGLLNRARGVGDFRALMGNAGESVRRVDAENFRTAIADNMLPSIDALLEHRKDLWPVGKRVMATLLYQEEARAGAGNPDTDWMALVFDAMAKDADNADAFGTNPVTFITFNYDRYFESRFIRGVAARYGIGLYDAWTRLATIKFLHLHGSLGTLPEQVSPPAQEGDVVALGAPETENVYTLGLALGRIESELSIVHDADRVPAVFDDALRAFQTAEQVIFLGFGFGDKNVGRLKTDRIPPTAQVYCTAYGMTGAEIATSIWPAFPQLPAHASIRQGNRIGDSQIKLFLRERIGLLR